MQQSPNNACLLNNEAGSFIEFSLLLFGPVNRVFCLVLGDFFAWSERSGSYHYIAK